MEGLISSPARRATRRRPRLMSLGDLMLDVIVRAEAGVEQGTDVAGTVRFRVGGSAANTARAFAGLGGAATFVGGLGDDSLARKLSAALRSAGVTVKGTSISGATPRLVAIVGADGERSFVTERGVADELRPADVKDEWLTRIDALHLPAYSLLNKPLADAAISAAQRAHAKGALVSVDLSSSRPLRAAGVAFVAAQIGRVAPHIILANADEAATLVGTEPKQRLLDFAQVVVIKAGARDCRVMWRPAGHGAIQQIDVGTKPLTALDTTGAGDAFDAGFLYSLIAEGASVTAHWNEPELRRAALAGHRAAGQLLSGARAELVL